MRSTDVPTLYAVDARVPPRLTTTGFETAGGHWAGGGKTLLHAQPVTIAVVRLALSLHNPRGLYSVGRPTKYFAPPSPH